MDSEIKSFLSLNKCFVRYRKTNIILHLRSIKIHSFGLTNANAEMTPLIGVQKFLAKRRETHYLVPYILWNTLGLNILR